MECEIRRTGSPTAIHLLIVDDSASKQEQIYDLKNLRDKFPRCTIICFTSHTRVDIAARAVRAGATLSISTSTAYVNGPAALKYQLRVFRTYQQES